MFPDCTAPGQGVVAHGCAQGLATGAGPRCVAALSYLLQGDTRRSVRREAATALGVAASAGSAELAVEIGTLSGVSSGPFLAEAEGCRRAAAGSPERDSVPLARVFLGKPVLRVPSRSRRQCRDPSHLRLPHETSRGRLRMPSRNPAGLQSTPPSPNVGPPRWTPSPRAHHLTPRRASRRPRAWPRCQRMRSGTAWIWCARTPPASWVTSLSRHRARRTTWRRLFSSSPCMGL